jgi:hypothetical protein
MKGYIKLRIPGETFWAKPLSETTAEIKNILVNPEYGFDDIVSHDGFGNVQALLIKKTYRVFLKYPLFVKKSEDKDERRNKIIKHFENENLMAEPAIAGLILIAVPVGIPHEAIVQISKSCPVKIELDFDEGEE